MPCLRMPIGKKRMLAASLVLCLATLICAGVAAFQAAWGWGCKAASFNGLQQIQIALQFYRQANGCYPPQYIVDKEGRPAHSWRVLIWQYLSSDDSWKSYRFDEPWDGPHNRLLASQMPACFRSPNANRNSKSTTTDYVGIVGTNTPWNGANPLRTKDVPSTSGKTIWFVEVANSGINRMEPRDVPLEQALIGINVAGGIQSNYSDGLPAQLMPYGGDFLPVDTPRDTLRAMLTIPDGTHEARNTASRH